MHRGPRREQYHGGDHDHAADNQRLESLLDEDSGEYSCEEYPANEQEKDVRNEEADISVQTGRPAILLP